MLRVIVWLYNKGRYVEGRINVLYQVVHIIFVLAEELVHLLETFVEGPET